MQDNEKTDDNIVFIGKKPLMNYVKSAALQLSRYPLIIIKARGKFISKAVDVAELARRKPKNDQIINIKDISIASEEFTANDKIMHASTIDITLSKN